MRKDIMKLAMHLKANGYENEFKVATAIAQKIGDEFDETDSLGFEEESGEESEEESAKDFIFSRFLNDCVSDDVDMCLEKFEEIAAKFEVPDEFFDEIVSIMEQE